MKLIKVGTTDDLLNTSARIVFYEGPDKQIVYVINQDGLSWEKLDWEGKALGKGFVSHKEIMENVLDKLLQTT